MPKFTILLMPFVLVGMLETYASTLHVRDTPTVRDTKDDQIARKNPPLNVREKRA